MQSYGDDDLSRRFNPLYILGNAIDRSAADAKQSARDAAARADLHLRGRPLTLGELAMVQAMFGTTKSFSRARVVPHNFWWPFPNNRTMTPNGNIFMPSQAYRADYSDPTVPLRLRALFLHEATHLYQYYVLGIWVMVRGPFDRNYQYTLIPGQLLKDYRLEQMGQIVEDYYTITQGGRITDLPYKSADYHDALPVKTK